MAKINLKQYGITGTTEVIYNPSYDELYREETRKGLRGYEKGQVTEMGAVNVMTGVYTGRSPKDKFFVMDETTKDTIWWTSPEYKNDNKPVTKKTWKELKKIAVEELSNKKLFVVDTFCGANENTRLKIRFIMEVAWQAHFVKNMFIRPTDEELEKYGEPDFVVLNASKAKVKNYKELGLNSETAVVFNLTEKMQVIINTWYGGEMKKGMFSYMNYLLFYEQVERALEADTLTEPAAADDTPEPAAAMPTSIRADIAARLEEWIAADGYTRPGLTITDVANDLLTNRTYLSGYINTTYDTTFREWITRLRIEYAKRLLLGSPELTVQDVSERSGFQSTSHFIRIFKERTACPPAKWRKSVSE